jgi:hypothetical protein
VQMTDFYSRLIRRTITSAVLVIALLTFAFGFGNGWQLGLSLGVPSWIAPLVAPAVDLSVVALLASLQYLRAHGIGGRLVAARVLLVLSGLITFSINTAHAVMAGDTGQACFDAVAPLLLIGWSEVGPRLLGLLHLPVTDVQDGEAEPPSEVADRPGPSPELIARARPLQTNTSERMSGQFRGTNSERSCTFPTLRPGSCCGWCGGRRMCREYHIAIATMNVRDRTASYTKGKSR